MNTQYIFISMHIKIQDSARMQQLESASALESTLLALKKTSLRFKTKSGHFISLEHASLSVQFLFKIKMMKAKFVCEL